METEASQAIDLVTEVLTTYGLRVIGAVVILIAGWVAAGWTARTIRKVAARSEHVDVMLGGFFASLARYGIIAVTVLAVLAKFGVQTASLVAVLGATGLAIALALQGTLGHIASGVMILFFRPFKVGDYVEVAGHGGTVKAVTLFTTELATPDNVQILIPNGQVWDTALRNFSHYETRRIEIILGIDYGDDIDKAVASVRSVLDAEARILPDPEPLVAVGALGASSVDLTIRAWTKRGDFFATKLALTKALKERMDADGISIPYPHQKVIMTQASK
jgi:small conductance mechanosensitive channel